MRVANWILATPRSQPNTHVSTVPAFSNHAILHSTLPTWPTVSPLEAKRALRLTGFNCTVFQIN
jgi:hypothetical protein